MTESNLNVNVIGKGTAKTSASTNTDKKLCPGCGNTLPIDDFYNNNYSKDGMSYRCKQCINNNRRKIRKERISKKLSYKKRGYHIKK